MFFKGEFYQQAEQLDRELNALWGKYPSLMPYDVRLRRAVDSMIFTGNAFWELSRAIDGAAVSFAGLGEILTTGHS